MVLSNVARDADILYMQLLIYKSIFRISKYYQTIISAIINRNFSTEDTGVTLTRRRWRCHREAVTSFLMAADCRPVWVPFFRKRRGF
jgi:hypothetical protein